MLVVSGVVRVLSEYIRAADSGIWVDGVGPSQSYRVKIFRGEYLIGLGRGPVLGIAKKGRILKI